MGMVSLVYSSLSWLRFDCQITFKPVDPSRGEPCGFLVAQSRETNSPARDTVSFPVTQAQPYSHVAKVWWLSWEPCVYLCEEQQISEENHWFPFRRLHEKPRLSSCNRIPVLEDPLCAENDFCSSGWWRVVGYIHQTFNLSEITPNQRIADVATQSVK